MSVERFSVSFTDRNAALKAAATACPTDVLIALGGDAKTPSRYIHGPGELAGMLESAEFGTRPFDRICIWVTEGQVPRPHH